MTQGPKKGRERVCADVRVETSECVSGQGVGATDEKCFSKGKNGKEERDSGLEGRVRVTTSGLVSVSDPSLPRSCPPKTCSKVEDEYEDRLRGLLYLIFIYRHSN